MPEYNEFFKNILKEAEKMSTCARLHVAAVIVKDGRIVSTGWNGVPSKQLHCRDIFYKQDVNKNILSYADHHKFSNNNEIHAEQNAIGFASRNGVSTNNSDIYLSISPCIYCAKLICASGIKNVFYISEYDREKEGINFLKKNNIKCEELK